MMRQLTVLLAAALSALAAPPEKFIPLFDGKTLDGWEQLNGSAKYTVEDGAIVGRPVKGSPNSFLCTKRPYGDFILEFETRVIGDINSGLQLRSHMYPAATPVSTWRDGKWRKQVAPEGRIYGYQVEIANKVHASGGIFDEARRGWLVSVVNDKVKGNAFKDSEWNKYRIMVMGDSIKTWINGIQCADLVDPYEMSGFLGLQVHQYGATDDTHIRWRDIRIQDLGVHAWQPLWTNGQLKSWKPAAGDWTTSDGVHATKAGVLMGSEQMGDFTVRLKFKSLQGKSAVLFRKAQAKGYRVALDAAGETGALYAEGGARLSTADQTAVSQYYKANDWNELAISAHGRRIVVHVNGIKTADLDNGSGPARGYLALQSEDGADVWFKDLEILRPSRTR
jgi:hypothetical protein